MLVAAISALPVSTADPLPIALGIPLCVTTWASPDPAGLASCGAPNGGFEVCPACEPDAPAQGEANMPLGWEKYPPPSHPHYPRLSPKITWSASSAHAGVGSIKLAAGAGGAGVITEPFAFRPGETITASSFHRSLATISHTSIFVNFYAKADADPYFGQRGFAHASEYTDASWGEQTVTAVVPQYGAQDTTFVRVLLYTTTGGNGLVQWDDVNLRCVAPLTPPSGDVGACPLTKDFLAGALDA